MDGYLVHNGHIKACFAKKSHLRKRQTEKKCVNPVYSTTKSRVVLARLTGHLFDIKWNDGVMRGFVSNVTCNIPVISLALLLIIIQKNEHPIILLITPTHPSYYPSFFRTCVMQCFHTRLITKLQRPIQRCIALLILRLHVRLRR